MRKSTRCVGDSRGQEQEHWNKQQDPSELLDLRQPGQLQTTQKTLEAGHTRDFVGFGGALIERTSVPETPIRKLRKL